MYLECFHYFLSENIPRKVALKPHFLETLLSFASAASD